MNDDVAISVKHLSKGFKLPHEKHGSVKNAFINIFSKNTYEHQQALKDISFDINKGDFFGIVGRNGSGKSTLLKLMAGIYHPDKGAIKINGKLVPFIELGVGFNGELSGRENVYLNGALLGFSHTQMDELYDEIVEFAELERFMDQKLKNYSSGMQVRLAFSVAIRAKGDILLLDEVLAVGDKAFQQKCYNYFEDLREEKKTVILVSHGMATIERFCNKALLLEDGHIKKMGDSSVVAGMYETMFLKEKAKQLQKERQVKEKENAEFNDIKIHSVEVLQDGKSTKNVKAHSGFQIEVSLSSKKTIDKANVEINIKNQDRLRLIATGTKPQEGYTSLIKNQKRTVIFDIENILTDGLYTINLGVVESSGLDDQPIFQSENVQDFIVKGIEFNRKSLTHPKVSVRISD